MKEDSKKRKKIEEPSVISKRSEIPAKKQKVQAKKPVAKKPGKKSSNQNPANKKPANQKPGAKKPGKAEQEPVHTGTFQGKIYRRNDAKPHQVASEIARYYIKAYENDEIQIAKEANETDDEYNSRQLLEAIFASVDDFRRVWGYKKLTKNGRFNTVQN
jgi:hypothetical protein